MEEKVEQLSERLEQLALDAFISVLASLNEHSKLILKSVKDEDIQFWSYDIGKETWHWKMHLRGADWSYSLPFFFADFVRQVINKKHYIW